MKKITGNENRVEKKIDNLAITVDKLALAVGRGFNNVDERLNKLEASVNMRFFEVHDQLGGLQNQMTVLERLFIKNNEEHKVFRTKIERLEKTK